MIGRYTGISGATGGSPAEYDVSYTYDTLGRLGSLASGSDTFTYAYLANSNLVESITYPTSGSPSVHLSISPTNPTATSSPAWKINTTPQ